MDEIRKYRVSMVLYPSAPGHRKIRETLSVKARSSGEAMKKAQARKSWPRMAVTGMSE